MEPGTDAGTGAGARPAGYLGQRRLHRTFVGRTGALLPLALVAVSVVTVLLVFAVSAMLPSEAAPIPGARTRAAGSSGTPADAPLAGPASSAAPGPTALAVTNPGMQTGTVGAAVRLQLEIAGSGPGQRLTWSATGLPKGVTMDARTGLVTGTPTTAGTSTVTVTVRSPTNASASATFVWMVNPTSQAAVGNGGFEADGLAPWACGSSTATVVGSPVHGGGHALRGTPTDTDIAQCAQSVTVAPNTRYTLTAWVSGKYADAGVTGPGTPDRNTSGTTAAGAYRKLTVSFTTGANATTVTVYVHGWYGQGPYEADDISLTTG